MKWLDKLKDYAPDIATAVLTGGATLPQLAIKAVSDAVGVDIQTENDLKQHIEKASPEDMLKITHANNTFKIRMRELDVELEQSELKNQEHARDSHNHSIIPAAIAFILTGIVVWLFYELMNSPLPDNNRDIFMILLGQTSALWGASITYWVGTTRSSANKTAAMIGKK